MKNLLYLLTHFYFETPKVNAPSGLGSSSSGGAIGDTNHEKDDLAVINADDDAVVDDDEEVVDDEEDEEATTDDEVVDDEVTEEETEETDEEKEAREKLETSDDDPVKANTYKSIKAKYPNFFKDFPEAKNQIFAAESFRKIFPTVEEAQEAHQTVEAYNAVSSMITDGKTDEFVGEVKNLGADVFKTFSANILPALYKEDRDTYYAVVTPVVRTALRSIVNRGIELGGKIGGTEDNAGQNLINAAIVAHLDLFGNKDVAKEDEPLVKKKDDDPERKKLDDEKQQFLATKYNDLKGSVDSTVNNQVVAEIQKGLDPGNSLSKYMRTNLTRDILQAVDAAVSKDTNFINGINALWKKEQAAGFTGVHKQEIIRRVLSRAKPLIPEIRKRLRAEALTGAPKAKVVTPKFGQKKSSGKPGASNRPNADLRDTRKTSDLDIINS